MKSPDSAPREKLSSAKSILVLDEEVQTTSDLKAVLEALGHRVDVRARVTEALLAKLDLGKFDLVICDSDHDAGLWKRVLNRIRSHRLDTQLVLTSRQSAEVEWLEALQLGVFDLLPKPYSTSETLRVTTNALAFNYNHKFKTA